MFAAFEPHAHGDDFPATIRPATFADLDACATLSQDRNGGDFDVWHARLAADLTASDQLSVVAVSVGSLVGFATAGRLSFDPAESSNIADGWYLTGVVVHPAHRRRGLGHRLLQARLDWLDQRSDRVWYFASAANRASLELHRRLGFEEMTRDFIVPKVSFTDGVGVLCLRYSKDGSARAAAGLDPMEVGGASGSNR